jgi:hypothetical protein
MAVVTSANLQAFNKAEMDKRNPTVGNPPQILYHGTGSGDFENFDTDESKHGVEGVWLTEEKPYAQWIADHHENGKVLKIESHAKNPMHYDVMDEGKKIASDIGVDHPRNPLEAQEMISGGLGWDSVVRDLVHEAKSKGHDSLKITSFNDAWHSNPKETTTAHVVFNPKHLQIVK